MINNFITSMAVSAILLFSTISHAQVELKADGGSFEDIVPWGEGYLGVVQTQMYAVMPKFRQFQYFDKSGKQAWNTKVTPFNFNNQSLCNAASDYAYYINMPYGKTAMTEKTSKTDFINIYRIDRSGTLVEKNIPYAGVLQPLQSKLKDITTCYIGAAKDGIVMVVSTDDKTYHIVRVDSEFNVSYQSATFAWDEKLHEANKLSRPKFVLGDTYFSMIQLSHTEKGIKADSKSYELADISKVSPNTNVLSFEGFSLNSDNSYELDYTIDERVITSYTREKWVGDKIYIYPTLGKFLEFTYVGGNLYAYAYFRNENAAGKTEKEGLLVYKLDPSKEANVEPVYTSEFDTDGNKLATHAIHIGLDDEFVFISRKAKKNMILKTSGGDSKTFGLETSVGQAFIAYVSKSGKVDQSEEIDCVSPADGGYVGMDFEGMSNSFGNTKRVVIYSYGK